jgi:uncharacterized protein YprB with RNaseH-like and TPR domain
MRYNTDMSSLTDKLKALGVKTGREGLRPPDKESQEIFPVEKVVDGNFIPTMRGETYSAYCHYPLDHCQGDVPILYSDDLDMLALWSGSDELPSKEPGDFVFLDTETSGLSGGTGTYAFMVGAGRFEDGGFHLEQFFMRDPGEEAALLEALANFLAPASILVTYNGKTFDGPLLKTRYRLHNMPVPFKDMIHLDLLPLARRLWRDRLPSRTLKYIEENILGLPRTDEEVPGYEIPYLYFDYLRTRDARPLAGVFYHNNMDIVSLAAMLNHMNHMLAQPLDKRIEHGLDRIALAKLHEDLGKWDQAASLYERGLQETLPEVDFSRAVKRLSALQRRRGDLVAAVDLWKKAAQDGHIYAHIEIAKHHEHRLRDPETAMKWTLTARQIVEQDKQMPDYMRNHWLEEVNHRLKRLERKTDDRRNRHG